MVEARREFPASEAVHDLLLLPEGVDTQLIPVGRPLLYHGRERADVQ